MTRAQESAGPRKIGEGHAQAMLRQGLREIQNLVFPSNVGPEPGTFGSPTQGEIAAERHPDPRASILDRHTGLARQGSPASSERGRMVHDGPDAGIAEPERE